MIGQLTLKRAPIDWNQDDCDVLEDGARINQRPPDAS
jgi:hypothetical protein